MTDSAVGKNVEHIVLTFKNHQTNVHDLGVSVSSIQLSTCLSRPILRKRSPVGGDNHYKEMTHADISLRSTMEDTTATRFQNAVVLFVRNQLCRQMKKDCSTRYYDFCDGSAELE